MSLRTTIFLAALSTLLIKQPLAAVASDTKQRPHMDLAFCIDTTGSMGAEIGNVKTKVKELVSKLASGKPTPIIRVGLVAYRDRGDAYVTKVFPFTEDIDAMVKDINDLQAQGGGDGPESVNEGLHAAVSNLNWDESKRAAKLLFLIGDAGPHYYPNDYNWEDESKKAVAKGIQINTIGCNGLQSYPPDQGVDVFKKIAKLADGAYEPLAYRQTVATARGMETRITSTAGSFALAKDAETHWRDGISALSATKALSRAPEPSFSVARNKSYGMPALPIPAGVGGSYAAAETAKGTENNLDAIMLKAAESKAKKDLGVDY